MSGWPSAVVLAPEEWGWPGYLYSGYDQQYAKLHGWTYFPDRGTNGGCDYCPSLLDQFRQRATNTRHAADPGHADQRNPSDPIRVRGRDILLLPGHEAMVRETEAVYAKVYAEALRRRPRYVGALAQRWLAR